MLKKLSEEEKEKLKQRMEGRIYEAVKEATHLGYELRSNPEDYTLIADVIELLTQNRNISAARASVVLQDALGLIQHLSILK